MGESDYPQEQRPFQGRLLRQIFSRKMWRRERREVPAEMDDPEGCVALGFSKKDQTCIAVLGPQDRPTDGTTPMLYAPNIR
jgi:hypothetical protein